MTEEDKAAWDMYFSAIVGWSQHPGYYRDNATKLTLEECAKMADEMVLIRKKRPITVI